MASPAPVPPEVEPSSTPHGTVSLGAQERAVLSVLAANTGKVLGRRELSRLAGLGDLSDRRCDSVLVGIRRALGPESITTVRSRGWMLSSRSVDAASALLAS